LASSLSRCDDSDRAFTGQGMSNGEEARSAALMEF
jgi:hypothetical protein